MNQSIFSKIINKALTVIKKSEIGKNGTIASPYFSYISSFVPTIIQSGLYRALSFYQQEDSQSDRKAIFTMVNEVVMFIFEELIAFSDSNIKNMEKLVENFNYLSTRQRLDWQKWIITAAIACKLAIRSFPENPNHKTNKIKNIKQERKNVDQKDVDSTNASFVYYVSGKDQSLNNTKFSDLIKDIPLMNKNSYKDYFQVDVSETFKLKTTYPGLLIGAGYCHPALIVNDFHLGFYFDHTTGIPVIPGSSIKGILKSIFPKSKDDDEIKNEKLNYIHDNLHGSIKINHLKENWEEIFFKNNQVFYDAFIYGIPNDGKIFADDYITHHPGIFREPNPIRFLKIAPEVEFTFQFHLTNYNKNGVVITKEIKKKLFRQIILDFGVGAKRNVGYGTFK